MWSFFPVFRDPIHTRIKWSWFSLPCFSFLLTWNQSGQVSLEALCVAVYLINDIFLKTIFFLRVLVNKAKAIVLSSWTSYSASVCTSLSKARPDYFKFSKCKQSLFDTDYIDSVYDYIDSVYDLSYIHLLWQRNSTTILSIL